MTKPDESIRRVIEDSLAPRRADAETYMAAARPGALEVAQADLLYLWDDYRTEYLDFASLVNPVGHRHPMIQGAITEQARYYGLTAPQGHHLLRWPVLYAKRLSEAFRGKDDPVERRVLFCEGEREAVYQAISMAGAGKRILILDTGWHDWLRHDYRTEYLPFLSDRKDIEWGNFGALLLSMVTTQAVPVPGVRELILLAREAGVPVIIDESVTGLGRTGTMWGQDTTGLMADLTVLGGPVGGGYPLGAVVALPDWFPEEPDASPLSAHPVACVAGWYLMEVIERGVLEYMEDSSGVFTRGLSELCDQFPSYLYGYHGTGHYQGLRFRDRTLASRFTLDARARGLYVTSPVGDTVPLAPVLITSTNEVGRGIDLISSVFLSWDEEAARPLGQAETR